MNKEITDESIIVVCGFHFYIKWENKQVGYDQHGHRWLDIKEPVCENQAVIDICMDGYNKIVELGKKSRK